MDYTEVKNYSFEILLACWLNPLYVTDRRDKATKNLIFNLRESFYIQLKRTGLQDNLTFNQGTDL